MEFNWTDVRFVLVFIASIFLWWGLSKIGIAVVKRNPSLRDPKIFRLWFAAFCVVSCLDIHSTYLMVQAVGLHIEGNLIPFLTMKYFGVIPGLLFRLVVVTGICFFVFRKFPELLVGFNLFYPLVPIWNYWNVFRAL